MENLTSAEGELKDGYHETVTKIFNPFTEILIDTENPWSDQEKRIRYYHAESLERIVSPVVLT